MEIKNPLTNIIFLQTIKDSGIPDYVAEKLIGTVFSAEQRGDHYFISFKEILAKKEGDSVVFEFFTSDPDRPIGELIKVKNIYCKRAEPLKEMKKE
jgi:hypothetical protein